VGVHLTLAEPGIIIFSENLDLVKAQKMTNIIDKLLN
jgi:hypothetical protein